MLNTGTALLNKQSRCLSASSMRIAFMATALLLSMVTIEWRTTAHAGAMAPCENLVLFEGANVNNYVKQFAGVTDRSIPLDKAGQMLAVLVQLDGLYSQIGYGPIGYVYIRTDSHVACSNQNIIARITHKECCSHGTLQPGKGALILAGEFQRLQEQLYLLTNIEFYRHGVEETVRFPSPVPDDILIKFSSRLPDTMVSFDPRKFTTQQLLQVANAFSDVMYVRKNPDSAELAQKIEPFDIDGFSYYVEEVRPDWMKIQSYPRAGLPQMPSGWVRVPKDIGGLGLRELLPELHAMDAAALYLQTRIARGTLSSSKYAKHLEKFETLLGAFTKRVQGPGDQRALGLLKSMHAILLLERPGPKITAEEMKRISAISAEAADLLPTSTEAQLLAALTRFSEALQSDVASFPGAALVLEKDLLQMLTMDPANSYVKADLEQLWRLRSSLDKSGWQTEKLKALQSRFSQDTRVQQLLK